MPQPPQLIIIVSQSNELVSAQDPSFYDYYDLKHHLAAGHIIRQVTKDQFDNSGLKPKHKI